MKQLLLLLAFLFFISCNNKNAEPEKETGSANVPTAKETGAVTSARDGSIVGKWTPIEMNFPKMEKKEKEKIINKASIEFTAGGKYISLSDGETETGTYDYDKGILTTYTAASDPEKLTVIWEKENLRMINDEGTVILKRINP
ncbi:MAG: hypothetical protein ABI688_09980 [Bacteroidota bacterium]